jgi:hypothetical protein
MKMYGRLTIRKIDEPNHPCMYCPVLCGPSDATSPSLTIPAQYPLSGDVAHNISIVATVDEAGKHSACHGC